MATEPIKKELSQDEQIVIHLIEKIGQPGWMPEDYAFLIQYPEYEHRPVGIREFITSPHYMDASSDCWPSVLSDLESIFNRPVTDLKISNYIEIIRKMGYGSGKGFRITFAFCYVAFRLLCFRDPQKMYGQAAGATLALVNSAITSTHAKKIIFGDISERINRSPWFQANAMPDPGIQSELRFPKNIVIWPGSSSEVAPVGYNIFMHNVDEAAFFPETETRDSARIIYDTGRKRVKSRFGDMGLCSAISSPSHVDNFIEQKCEEALTDETISAKEGPTWDNKPADIAMIARGEYFELAHPRTREIVKIPNIYQADFKKNPQAAWRDFGAVASAAIDPYFSEDEIYRIEQAMLRGRDIKHWAEANLIRGAVYHIHIDLGLVRDACGFVMAHEQHEKMIADLALRIVCARRAAELDRKQQRYDMVIGTKEVQIEEVRNIVFALQGAGFTIGCVSMDGFQSVDTRQQFEKAGIPAMLVSVDRDTSAYDTLKSLINTDRFETVNHSHALKECKSLELKKGKKVDHAPGATKDLMDGYAGCAKTLFDKYDEDDDTEETYAENESEEITSQI